MGTEDQNSRPFRIAAFGSELFARGHIANGRVNRVSRQPIAVAQSVDVETVVDITRVTRASMLGNEVVLLELLQVIRDEVVGHTDDLHQLADATVATSKRGNKLPSNLVREKPHHVRWLSRCCCLRHDALDYF